MQRRDVISVIIVALFWNNRLQPDWILSQPLCKTPELFFELQIKKKVSPDSSITCQSTSNVTRGNVQEITGVRTTQRLFFLFSFQIHAEEGQTNFFYFLVKKAPFCLTFGKCTISLPPSPLLTAARSAPQYHLISVSQSQCP